MAKRAPRLYIADDDVGLTKVLARMAERHGWSVTVCHDGDALVAALDKGCGPALLLIDICMPGKGGLNVIPALSQCPRRLRLRFITGGDYTEAFAAGMMAEAADLSIGRFIMKPISLDRLRAVLDEEAAALDKTAPPLGPSVL